MLASSCTLVNPCPRASAGFEEHYRLVSVEEVSVEISVWEELLQQHLKYSLM